MGFGEVVAGICASSLELGLKGRGTCVPGRVMDCVLLGLAASDAGGLEGIVLIASRRRRCVGVYQKMNTKE